MDSIWEIEVAIQLLLGFERYSEITFYVNVYRNVICAARLSRINKYTT